MTACQHERFYWVSAEGLNEKQTGGTGAWECVLCGALTDSPMYAGKCLLCKRALDDHSLITEPARCPARNESVAGVTKEGAGG